MKANQCLNILDIEFCIWKINTIEFTTLKYYTLKTRSSEFSRFDFTSLNFKHAI